MNEAQPVSDFQPSDRARHKDYGAGYVREVKSGRARFMPDLPHPITVLHNGEWLPCSELVKIPKF